MTAKARNEFERLILPHLPAAYSLARWLLRHPQDAEDAVQEAALKAYKGFHGFSGGNAQAWLLAIVRNTCLTLFERRRAEGKVVVLANVAHGHEALSNLATDPAQPQDVAMIAEEDRRRIRAAIASLPLQFREVLVLREFHDLSYREIAEIVGAPVGTVMSRLARGREKLTEALDQRSGKIENGTTS